MSLESFKSSAAALFVTLNSKTYSFTVLVLVAIAAAVVGHIL